MSNKNLEKYQEIKKMNGQRKLNGLPFYDILQNPDYRLLFEYADPVDIDQSGQFIFEKDMKDDDEQMEENEDEKAQTTGRLLGAQLGAALKLDVAKEQRDNLEESHAYTNIHKERTN